MFTPQELRQFEDVLRKVLEVAKDELMDTKKCAEWLGVSKDAIRQRCEQNKIPFHKKHGFLYFSKNEIMNYYTRDGQ